MLFIFILFFSVAFLSALTTIPLAIAVLVVATVVFKKSWVFFAALGIGLFLDISLLVPLGQTGLMFAIFIFILFLYERKFEPQTLTFVFFATFLGSLIHLKVFGYDNILVQSVVSAVISIMLFKFLILRIKMSS